MPPPPNPRDLDPVRRPTATPSPYGAASTASAANFTSASQSSARRRNDESWVEIASQPSSSSLSSIADEIVITGLRVGSTANGGVPIPAPQRRRRLLQQVDAAASAARLPTSQPRPTASTGNATSLTHPSATAAAAAAAAAAAGSSQEEYDETESEEDRVMSSSAEIVPDARNPHAFSLLQAQARLRRRAGASDGDDEEDASSDDDDGTALGMPSSGPATFRPQPNAFSHPPMHRQPMQPQPSLSPLPPPPPHQHIAPSPPYARSLSHQRSSQARGPRSAAPSFMSPSYREDNDAALRASLTTLLSCAAAARGLPKKEGGSFPGAAGGAGGTAGEPSGLRPSNQPMDLRLVPESELMDDGGTAASASRTQPTPFPPPRLAARPPARPGVAAAPASRPAATAAKSSETASATHQQHQQHHHHSSRNSAVSAVSTASKSKRASAGKSSSPRVTKKKRTSSSSAAAADGDAVAFISPTLLTWVVSAGVVVLVSVVGFGAGFVIGREVGRQEAASAAVATSSAAAPASGGGGANVTSCGHEIMRSSTGSTLRRFRWGAGMTKSVTAS